MTTELTISEVADLHGATKQAVSQRVQRLIAKHGDDWVSRDANGRVAGIQIARYEGLIRHVGDASKRPDSAARPAQAPSGDRPSPVIDLKSLDEAKRLRAWIDKERATLDYAERVGHLVRADLLESSLERVGAEIGAIIDRQKSRADDLAAGYVEDGIAGLRRAMKALSMDTRREIARLLLSIAADAAEEDPLIMSEEMLAAQ